MQARYLVFLFFRALGAFLVHEGAWRLCGGFTGLIETGQIGTESLKAALASIVLGGLWLLFGDRLALKLERWSSDSLAILGASCLGIFLVSTSLPDLVFHWNLVSRLPGQDVFSWAHQLWESVGYVVTGSLLTVSGLLISHLKGIKRELGGMDSSDEA